MKENALKIGLMGFFVLGNPLWAESENLNQSNNFLVSAEQDAASVIEAPPSRGESASRNAIRATGASPIQSQDLAVDEADEEVKTDTKRRVKKTSPEDQKDLGCWPSPPITCKTLLKSSGSPNASSEFIRTDALRGCFGLQALISVIGKPGFRGPRLKKLLISVREDTKKKLWILAAAQRAFQDPNDH
jgi:hypothetical protein